MIHQKGFWVGVESQGQHAFDPLLSQSLITFFKKEGGKVCDFGCGMGDYVRNMRQEGIDADGYDGNPNTPELTNGVGKVLDLSSLQILEKEYDWVVTLEVGEHIPKEYESTFIQNIMMNNKKGVVMSWAVKGQGGHGHVNCQNNDYIKSIFESYGYKNDIEAENWFRSNITDNCHWFRNTIMVFRK